MDKKEQELLGSRVEDALRQCSERNVPRFIGFLDSKGAATAFNKAKNSGVKYRLFGGYDAAERVYFGAFPDWSNCEESLFPISKLKVINKSDKTLAHRDFLGAFMAQGIERDTVGDILVGHPDSVVFVAESVAKHIILQIDKIGTCGVTVEPDETDYIPNHGGFIELSCTVASLRLDCVVSSLGNMSRGQAAAIIEDGLVTIGGIEVLKLTRPVAEGDVISIRKVGKFLIDSAVDRSKKNRIILKYRKYS